MGKTHTYLSRELKIETKGGDVMKSHYSDKQSPHQELELVIYQYCWERHCYFVTNNILIFHLMIDN